MSRIDGREAQVGHDETGQPVSVLVRGERQSWEVLRVVSHWREWLGALEGELERDIWHVLTSRGGCELHGLYPAGANDAAVPTEWILWRWDD